MESNWAEENLQTIRILMERSTIYRRALAPIMLFVGSIGLIGAVLGISLHLNSTRAFGCFWLAAAVLAVTGSFLIARRQAIKEHESFWSPPTKRVAQALLPPLTAGLIVGAFFGASTPALNLAPLLAFLWMLFYGCALHAAGFFMPRGIKVFGWVFITGNCVLLCLTAFTQIESPNVNWIMGFFFGVLHLAYGVYLYLTEKGKNAT